MPIHAGYINSFDYFKGFGFIRRDKGKDVYFSLDDFKTDYDIDSITIGVKLTFTILDTNKGPRATNINVTPNVK